MESTTEIIRNSDSLSGRFAPIRKLGEGAASSIVLVEDLANGGKHTALKILTNEEAFDEHTLTRFKREWEAMSRLRHPNIVEAYEQFPIGDTIAFAMEYVPGSDLGVLFHKQQAFRYEELDWILEQVLSGLSELHRHGIIHRDLKLENLLLREDGTVKIADLGLMKELTKEGLTRADVLLGTAQYLPPEYVKAGQFGAQGDLYALGIILLELLTGKRWLDDLNGMEAVKYLLKNRFEIPEMRLSGIPRKYRSIIRRATAVRPEDRYQSADQMKADLARSVEDFSEQPAQGAIESRVRFRPSLYLKRPVSSGYLSWVTAVSLAAGAGAAAILAFLFLM